MCRNLIHLDMQLPIQIGLLGAEKYIYIYLQQISHNFFNRLNLISSSMKMRE
jgi:hypothetical protein